jgi:hypothetical protein
MICMWFTGINYYKLAVEKDRDSIFTTIATIWKPGCMLTYLWRRVYVEGNSGEIKLRLVNLKHCRQMIIRSNYFGTGYLRGCCIPVVPTGKHRKRILLSL